MCFYDTNLSSSAIPPANSFFPKKHCSKLGNKSCSMREDMPQCPNCCSCSFCDNVFLIPWPSCSMTWSQSWTWSPKIEELSESRRSPNQSTCLQRWEKALTRQPAQLPSFQLQIQPTQPLQQPMQPLPLQMQQPHLQTQPMAMVPVQMQQDIPQATTPGMLLAVPYPMPMDWQKEMSMGMGMLPMVMSTTLGTIISDSSDGFWSWGSMFHNTDWLNSDPRNDTRIPKDGCHKRTIQRIHKNPLTKWGALRSPIFLSANEDWTPGDGGTRGPTYGHDASLSPAARKVLDLVGTCPIEDLLKCGKLLANRQPAQEEFEHGHALFWCPHFHQEVQQRQLIWIAVKGRHRW